MWVADKWEDYELIDASNGERLERWGRYILRRPDPQIVWDSPKTRKTFRAQWEGADAIYKRSSSGGGGWSKNTLPATWNINYGTLRFCLKPMGFKHTGLFPEQAVNWDWFSELIKKVNRPIKVLNLFAYTGGATVAALSAGASVVHVDAAKGMVAQAKENVALSGYADASVRYIVDDCKKFVEREIRRGNKYDAVIMDPPSYGRGPSGEVWKIEDNINELIELTLSLLSSEPLFFLVNSYTTGLSSKAIEYILNLKVGDKAESIESDELGLRVTSTSLPIPCGSSVRVTWKNHQ